VQEYAIRAGVAQSVMTRTLLGLRERNRKKEPGYGLVMQRMDPLNLRRHQTFLSTKGRALVQKLCRAWRPWRDSSYCRRGSKLMI
jgi:DNA-binding MarR family transcriptional regulator